MKCYSIDQIFFLRPSVNLKFFLIRQEIGFITFFCMILGEHILHFLVLITGCTSAGKLGTSEIYRVTNVATVSLRGYQPDEEKVAEIRKLLCCGTFYYSWSNDPRYGNTGCGVFKGGIQLREY